MEFNRRKRMHYHLNITPLIDIVFLLLIFFMLTANFLNQKGISIDLPGAAYAEEETEEDIVISIDSKKRVFVGQERTGISSLEKLLREKIDGASNRKVTIRGDRSADFGTAVKIMDIAKETGAEAIMIVTELEAVE